MNMSTKSKYLLILLLITSFCIVSCEKTDTNNDSDFLETTNWWYRSGLVSDGIRSIEQGDEVFLYDRAGRLIQNDYPGISLLYEYNSQGLISKRTVLDTENDNKVITTTTYEYDNIGKFVPNVTIASLVTQLNVRGLLPNLSKITVVKEQRTFSTEFKFYGDTLVISDNSLGDDNIFTEYVLYRGSYPYSTTSGTVGPITYQKNGMFSTIRIGWSYYFYNEEDRYMLLKQYSVYDTDQYKEFVNYTYDNRGNTTKIEWTEIDDEGRHDKITDISYKYDERGNWIEQTVSDGTNAPSTNTRKIVYWN